MITPISPVNVTPHGGFAFVRRTPSEGACGVASHPCVHYGVDLGAPAGTAVRAPINALVVATGDGNSSPWRGYGPYVAVLLGIDGYYQLIAHMNPGSLRTNQLVSEGQIIGTVSSANHVHWEVRKRKTPPSGGSNATNNLDPLAWVGGAYGDSSAVKYVALLATAGLGYYAFRTWRSRGGTLPVIGLK